MGNKIKEDIINVEILLELYRQASMNARGYINLRHKHFSIFIAMTAMTGAVAFAIPELHPFHATVVLYGILNTLLFWLLDHRTETLYLAKRQRVKACEKLLDVQSHFIPDTDEQPGIRITMIKHLIFALILAAWLAIECFIVSHYTFNYVSS